MLVIINGASGAGKTYLLEHLGEIKGCGYVPIKKYTTRCRRTFESEFSTDLIFNCSETDIKQYKYHYMYKGEWYGIDHLEIEDCVLKHQIPVVIVRSFQIIHKLQRDFENTISIFVIGACGDTLREQLLRQGRSNQEIESSNEDLASIIREYVENQALIDQCIINCLYDKKMYLQQFIECTKERAINYGK